MFVAICYELLKICSTGCIAGANPFVRQPPPHRARVQPGARENRAPNAGPNLPEAPGAGARSDTQAAGGAVQAVQRSPGRAWHDGSGTSPLSPLLVRQGCAARVPVRTQEQTS